MEMKRAELLVALRSQQARYGSQSWVSSGVPASLLHSSLRRLSHVREGSGGGPAPMNYKWWRGKEEEMGRWLGGLGPAGLGAYL